MPRGIVALVFRCRVIGGALEETDESAEFRWADADAVRQLSDPAYAVRALDALRAGEGVAVRAHDGVRLV